MFSLSYPVLLVDDDPDVLSVSKLALRNINVFGVPLEIFTATSKAEAIELLNRITTRIQTGHMVAPLAIALIDVVMETDTAGLELCQYIRETSKNRITQIYIRTGQPGLAPERSVIDRYDINGYYTKAEMTEQKLYTLVKAGVRQVHNTSRSDVAFEVVDALIANSGSTEQMSYVLDLTLRALGTGPDGKPVTSIDPRIAVVMGGKLAANGMNQDAEAVLSRSRQLAALPGTPLGSGADRYVRDGNHFQITVAESPSTVEAQYLAMTTGETPEFMVAPFYRFLHAAAGLWKKASPQA